jgi:hypothetical protein
MYSIAESALWNLGQKAMALIIKTDTFYTVKKNTLQHPGLHMVFNKRT